MPATELAWGRICTLDFPRAVGRYLREVGELARMNEVRNHEANGGKLRPADPHGNLVRLVGYVEGLRLEDQTLCALQMANFGTRPDTYEPSRSGEQFKFLRRLADHDYGGVEPADALEGLVVAALADAEEHLRHAAGARQEAEEIAAQKVADIERLREELDETAAARYDLQSKVDELTARVGELTDQLDWERAGDSGEPDTNGQPRKRRQPVDGEKHIYWGENASGVVVYEVDWRDDGRRRWKTVGPDLDEARAMRDELWGVAA